MRLGGHRGGASTRNGLALTDTLGIHTAGDVEDQRQARRAKALPAMQLPARVEQALQRSVSNGHVAGQPVYKEDPRKTRRGRADSAVRSDLATWLGTPDGRRYREERAALATGGARPGGDRRPGGNRRPGGGAAKSASSKG